MSKFSCSIVLYSTLKATGFYTFLAYFHQPLYPLKCLMSILLLLDPWSTFFMDVVKTLPYTAHASFLTLCFLLFLLKSQKQLLFKTCCSNNLQFDNIISTFLLQQLCMSKLTTTSRRHQSLTVLASAPYELPGLMKHSRSFPQHYKSICNEKFGHYLFMPAYCTQVGGQEIVFLLGEKILLCLNVWIICQGGF